MNFMAFRIRSLLLCLVIFGSTVPFYAQNSSSPPEPASGIPPASGLQLPIDDHIWVLLIMGLFLGIYFLKKEKC
jgi:hypothetical protein